MGGVRAEASGDRRGGGRVSRIIKILFPEELIRRIDEARKDAGLSRAAWIRTACVEKLRGE
jgi:metal-responsive CopG/Arc/MetJ family transcriptional regulator